jgi:hypothetical protein
MNIYKLSPSASSTFGAVNLTSAQSFTINHNVDVTKLGSDGKPYITAVLSDNLSASLSVTTTDTAINIVPGTTGSLVLKAVLHNNGSGAGTAATFTFANCVAGTSSVSINHSGQSTLTINFDAYSSDGTTSYMAIS